MLAINKLSFFSRILLLMAHSRAQSRLIAGKGSFHGPGWEKHLY
jgi:hypothetical protein